MTAIDPKCAGPSPADPSLNGGSDDSSPGDIFALLAARLPPTLNNLSHAFNCDAAPEQERSRYVIALHALAQFLRGFHGSDLYADKLMELASALGDLDDGISPPLLTPAGRGKGRRPEPSAKMRGRAFVALALDALIRAGKEDAASYIQRHYQALDSLRDRKSPSIADAAKEWRDAFSAGAIKDPEAIAIFQSVRPTLTQLGTAQLQQRAKTFLEEAMKIAAYFSD